MTATYNPKSAAAEARANYREVTEKLGVLGLDTAIPEGVRALAEHTVDQTREAYLTMVSFDDDAHDHQDCHVSPALLPEGR